MLLHITGAHSLFGPPQMQQDNGDGDNNGGQFPEVGGPGRQMPDGNMGNGDKNGGTFGHGHNGHGPIDNNNSNGSQKPPRQENGTQTPDSDQSVPGNKEQDKQDNDDNDDNSTKETSILTTSIQPTELQTSDNQPDGNQNFTGPDMGDRSMNGGGHGMHHGGFLMQVLHSNRTSLASKIAVVATTILGFLWVILAWLTIVCYLFRSSTFSRMNPALWTVLGIIGNVFALIAFFIVRSILRIRCAGCGSWQDIDQAYCSSCGKKLQHVCAACGATVSQDAAYCARCGAEQTVSSQIEEIDSDRLSESEESTSTNNLTDAEELSAQNEMASPDIPETDGNDADEE